MGIAPAAFWRITLAEWRAMIEGYQQRHEDGRYQRAWSASYQLIAAGVDAAKVTPEKLLGIPEKKIRAKRAKKVLSLNELYERMNRVDATGKPMPKEQVINGKV